jgi:hypothetical protein
MQGETAPPAEPLVTNIGVILVHGIGEQRRFEHLDTQLRFLIRALHGLKLDPANPVDEVSVDIRPSSAAAFHAEADSWSAGPQPTVTIIAHSRVAGALRETRLQVHEVWWADVNEAYSLAKQLRFWIWGLAVWSRASKADSNLARKAENLLPQTRAQVDVEPPITQMHHKLWDRGRLFMVGVYFTLLGYSIGTLSFLGNRLLNLRTPKILQLLTNYISGVKIYNQRHRYGPGIVPQWEEFLDSVGEPPRVSIRRRMIRAIADVACNDYDRWYVLAHSLGAVVAFNGLMETAYSWPGYLDTRRWLRLVRKGWTVGLPAVPSGATMPRRPGWLAPNTIVNRQAIFGKFSGFLTYGAPLEKFASIWPALVPRSLEPGVFGRGVVWLNVYDPLDPVSGRLEAFAPTAAGACPPVANLGYCAGWVLLLAHSQYLKRRQNGRDLATAVVEWLLTDSTAAFGALPNSAVRLGDRFTAPGATGRNTGHWLRSLVAWTWWLGTAAILLALGANVLPVLLRTVGAVYNNIALSIEHLGGPTDQATPHPPTTGEAATAIPSCLTKTWNNVGDGVAWMTAQISDNPFFIRSSILLLLAIGLPLFVGVFVRLIGFRRDDDDPRKSPLPPAIADRRRHGI